MEDKKQPQPPHPDFPGYTHTPAVAVGSYSDGLKQIWWGLCLNLTGLFPLTVLLTSLNHPNNLVTLGSWLLVSPLLVIGIVLSGFGVKDKGYQKKPIRIFGAVSLCAGSLLFLIPLAASVLLASGIGS